MKCLPDLLFRDDRSWMDGVIWDRRRFVEENFTFEKVVENWKRVPQDIE